MAAPGSRLSDAIAAIIVIGLLSASIVYAPNSASSENTGSIVGPSIAITGPAADSVQYKSTLTVTGTTTDGGGAPITNVTIQIKKGVFQNAIPVSPGNWSSWTSTLDMTRYRVGQYNIVVNATNAAGISNSTSVRIAYSLYDNFASNYVLSPSTVSPDRKWYGIWNGGGSFGTRIVNGTGSFHEESSPVTAKLQTNSALATTTQNFKNFTLSVDVTTNQQLRQNDPPNSWEVGWIIWHWKDNTHFKYFVVKTDGAEIGKYDGGTNPASQKIIKTSQSVKAVIGKTMHWRIIVKGSHTTVYVDGSKVFDLYNTSTYYSGKVGLYSEDSAASFCNLNILPLH